MHGSHPTVPQNAAVSTGTRIVINCQPSNAEEKILWHYLAPGTRRSKRIYNGFDLAPGYESNYSITEQNELAIDAASHAHAGLYICEESGTLSKFEAELIVIRGFENSFKLTKGLF